MSTELKIDKVGTLPRPGPIGRLLRLSMGVACLYALIGLAKLRGPIASGDPAAMEQLAFVILFGAWIASYVINIGFLVEWGRKPTYALIGAFGVAAGYGAFSTSSIWSPALGLTIWISMVYVYAHLGINFLLAATFATPGCEMRAPDHVLARLTGRPAKEHHCPVGPIQPLDTWEARQFWHRKHSGM